jgi:tungstate transport system ATP-binding protein
LNAEPRELPIVLRDVTVTLGTTNALQGATLRIDAGTPTVLIGPNGSGKTTLLRVAMGLVRPTHGAVLWGDRADAPPLRRAFVFQRPVMLRRSVAANVRYALETTDVARSQWPGRVEELLTLVGLGGLENRPAPRLSGGERQRLALARALARDPSVLLLDEPTASLDPAATQAIEELIRAISQRGVKVVMTTHDLGEAARLAGEIVLLHKGRVAEAGPASLILNNPVTEEARRFVSSQLLV